MTWEHVVNLMVFLLSSGDRSTAYTIGAAHEACMRSGTVHRGQFCLVSSLRKVTGLGRMIG